MDISWSPSYPFLLLGYSSFSRLGMFIHRFSRFIFIFSIQDSLTAEVSRIVAGPRDQKMRERSTPRTASQHINNGGGELEGKKWIRLFDIYSPSACCFPPNSSDFLPCLRVIREAIYLNEYLPFRFHVFLPCLSPSCLCEQEELRYFFFIIIYRSSSIHSPYSAPLHCERRQSASNLFFLGFTTRRRQAFPTLSVR